ncbi:hypothetical protein, partial [Burkholderia pseudomallei]
MPPRIAAAMRAGAALAPIRSNRQEEKIRHAAVHSPSFVHQQHAGRDRGRRTARVRARRCSVGR